MQFSSFGTYFVQLFCYKTNELMLLTDCCSGSIYDWLFYETFVTIRIYIYIFRANYVCPQFIEKVYLLCVVVNYWLKKVYHIVIQ